MPVSLVLLIVWLGIINAFYSPMSQKIVRFTSIGAKEEAPEEKKAKLGFGDLVQVSE